MPASLAGEVEQAVSGGDPSRRVEALRRITRLFVEQAPALNDSHVEVFDEVILRLAHDIEFRARISLADQLAPIDNAPRAVVNDLARDDNIRVAQPLLERSTALSEEDLVEIAAEKGQGHLFALSRRETLSERVTDVLVNRGNQRVVRSVAGNEGARFSEGGFAQLLDKARGDESLQTIIRARADIPPTAMHQLVAIAGAKVREMLTGEMGDEAGLAIEAAVSDAALGLERAGETADLTGRSPQGGEPLDSREVNEDAIVKSVKAGQVEAGLVAMAQLAKIPISLVLGAYHSANYDPILFITRSLGFGWGTFKLLLTCKAGRDVPESVLTSAFEAFHGISVTTARRVVHFTAIRERAAKGEAA